MAKGTIKLPIHDILGSTFSKEKYRIPKGQQDIVYTPYLETITLKKKVKRKRNWTELQNLQADLYCKCDKLYAYLKEHHLPILLEWQKSKKVCDEKNLTLHSCFMKYCLSFDLADLLHDYLGIDFIEASFDLVNYDYVITAKIGQILEPEAYLTLFRPRPRRFTR